jgi:1-acyl-sn-glycerol-3-phosphate acyltransferase
MVRDKHFRDDAWRSQGGPRSPQLYSTLQVLASPLIRAFFGVKRTFQAKIPKKGGVILASNHCSNLDPVLVVGSIGRPVYHLGKHTLFTSHAKAWFFQHLGGQIAVDRSGKGNEAAIDAAVLCVEQGGALGIYPEGHRSPDGRVHRGRTGVARVAVRTGAPIYPVAIKGTYEVWPKGQGLPKLFRPTEVIVGSPRTYPREPALVGDDRLMRSITDDVMRDIARLLGQSHDPATMPLLQPGGPNKT